MEDYSPDKLHTDCNDCLSFLQTRNVTCAKLTELLTNFQKSCQLDCFLHTFTTLIQSDEIGDIIAFLRSLEVLDVSDCEGITNRAVNKTTAEEVIALVDTVRTKGPHGLWLILHAMRLRHPEFFSQMHGDIECCVCDKVQQIQTEEKPQEEQSLLITQQPEVLSDLLRKVDQLKNNFLSLETRITELIDKVSPLQHIRKEINDVMSNTQSNYIDSFCHTNITLFNRVKLKLFRHLQPSGTQEDVPASQNHSNDDTIVLKEVVCSKTNFDKDNDSTSQDKNVCAHIEENFLNILSNFNPFSVLQTSVERVTLYVKANKAKVVILVGAAVCFEIIGSCLIKYEM